MAPFLLRVTAPLWFIFAMITLLHTSAAHVATFDTLRERLSPKCELTHLVREDWLARAQGGIDAALADEITEAIATSDGVVLCSCTTLGPVAAQAGAIRIDTPMMEAAARIGGALLMVYALESTRAPSLALLNAAVAAQGGAAEVTMLDLSEFWPLFEAGETEAFAACIAGGVRAQVLRDKPACIVLAQASMAAAAPLLSDLGLPVLASPEMAMRAALSAAGSSAA